MLDYLKAKIRGDNAIKIKTSILNADNFIGEGGNGKIYIINNDECVKIWKQL